MYGPYQYGQMRTNNQYYPNAFQQQQQQAVYFNGARQGSMGYGTGSGVLLNANQGTGGRRRRR